VEVEVAVEIELLTEDSADEVDVPSLAELLGVGVGSTVEVVKVSGDVGVTVSVEIDSSTEVGTADGPRRTFPTTMSGLSTLRRHRGGSGGRPRASASALVRGAGRSGRLSLYGIARRRATAETQSHHRQARRRRRMERRIDGFLGGRLRHTRRIPSSYTVSRVLQVCQTDVNVLQSTDDRPPAIWFFACWSRLTGWRDELESRLFSSGL
jgi:hypothetical protein